MSAFGNAKTAAFRAASFTVLLSGICFQGIEARADDAIQAPFEFTYENVYSVPEGGYAEIVYDVANDMSNFMKTTLTSSPIVESYIKSAVSEKIESNSFTLQDANGGFIDNFNHPGGLITPATFFSSLQLSGYNENSPPWAQREYYLDSLGYVSLSALYVNDVVNVYAWMSTITTVQKAFNWYLDDPASGLFDENDDHNFDPIRYDAKDNGEGTWLQIQTRYGDILSGSAFLVTSYQYTPGTVSVPGPEAGAGIGTLAMGGLAYWMHRRRREPVAA